MSPDDDEIRVARDGPVVRVELHRPARLNALTPAAMTRLADRLAALDDSVRVVVLTGAGRAFCAGADISGEVDGDGLRTLEEGNRVVELITSMPRAVVAAVNGPAAGIGCSLALACDIVVAAESAYFYLPFTGIGLMPDGGATLLVPANIGRARAMHMALLPERVGAAEAYRMGLVYRVVGDDGFAAAVDEVVARLAGSAALAAAATKRAVNAATLHRLPAALAAEHDGQRDLMGTDDAREGVAAFAERRPPRFTGR
jgi:enoyl-CoA hydratase